MQSAQYEMYLGVGQSQEDSVDSGEGMRSVMITVSNDISNIDSCTKGKKHELKRVRKTRFSCVCVCVGVFEGEKVCSCVLVKKIVRWLQKG